MVKGEQNMKKQLSFISCLATMCPPSPLALLHTIFNSPLNKENNTMRNNLSKIVLVASFWLAMIFTIPCEAANNPPALVGHWLYLSGIKKDDMELFKDGTGLYEGISISWKVENKRFIIQSPFLGLASNYKLSGSKLTLIYNDGDSTIFAKKADYEKEKKKMEAEREKAAAAAKREKAAAIKVEAEKLAATLKAKIKKGSFTDSRDGKVYKTMNLDKQTWMSENLNYNTNGSKCYDNDESNCQKYGRLYNWSIAKSVCPSGWHLPSDTEWDTLITAVGGKEIAEPILKAENDWTDNGIDAVGFSALPGGVGRSDGSFFKVGNCGFWWSASESHSNSAYYRGMGYNGDYACWDLSDKGSMFSVRCLQD